MSFIDFHTHACHPGAVELVSAPVRPEGAKFWSLELHPWHCGKIPEGFETLLAQAEALGEVGFDKNRGLLAYPDEQCALFSSALEFAVELHKPVVIHAVGSFELLFQTVRPVKDKIHLLFHGFSRKNPDLLAHLVAQGFWVSLSPRILEDMEIRKYCAANPHRIGLESDDGISSIEELYTCFALPEFAAHAEENWKEFWEE